MGLLLRIVVALVLLFECSFAAFALQAGAAKKEITPPLGSPLNGYGYRMGRGASEVHDPLWARALYLEDDDTALFLVSVDLCVMNRELRERVIELMPAIVPAEHVILTATHNHSGTGGMSKNLIARAVTGPFRPELIDLTAQGIVDAMVAAHEARVRATIGYGVTTQEVLTKNRREEGGPIDQQLGVIRVDNSDGQSIAIVASMAAHPTTVGEDYAFAISADFPGYYYTAMEGMASEDCVAMFLNGAEGNQQCGNPESLSGWAHTESIGKLLAVRAKGLANDITGREVQLSLNYSTPTLPRTLASSTLPPSTLLQTLEIDDLLLTFFPGEPCVEIGLELRRQALNRGYRAQFSVALSNDHLMYFAPEEYYGRLHYETGMNFYGPRIADWFYSEFGALMSRGDEREVAVPPNVPALEDFAGATRVTLSGTHYEMGYERGMAFKDAILSAYESRVVSETRDGTLVPNTGLWAVLPGVIEHSQLALVRMAIGSRTLLNGLDGSLIAELAGMADAVELPFDAVWLLQLHPTYVNPEQIDALYRAPFCTMLAATGDRAGADRILVGRNLDWYMNEPPTVVEYQPEDGHDFIQVGFGWQVGALSAMNERGLVAAVERVVSAGDPSFDAPAVEMVLRECMLRDATVEAAAARIAAFAALRGFHILLADSTGNAVVLELNESQLARLPEDGLLLGVQPERADGDEAAQRRYARASALLSGERILSVEELQRIMTDGDPSAGRDRIANADTQHAVVFSPTERTVYLSFPDAAGKLEAFTPLTISDDPR